MWLGFFTLIPPSPGYGVLIKAYVQFLQAKMDYHQQHPAFRANFDYEEYVSLRGVEDPNEGYVLYTVATHIHKSQL